MESAEEFLKKFKEDHDEEGFAVDDLRVKDSSINGVLKEIQNPPNNLQFAIAQLAYDLVAKYEKQIYVLPCGTGKSRISSCITLLLLKLRPSIKKIHLVYANEILKKKDQIDFEDLLTLMKAGDRVHYHTNIDFNPGSHSIVILDDCDDDILDNP